MKDLRALVLDYLERRPLATAKVARGEVQKAFWRSAHHPAEWLNEASAWAERTGLVLTAYTKGDQEIIEFRKK